MILVAQLFYRMKDLFFFFRERLQCPIVVVNHTDGRRKAQIDGAFSYSQSVFGVFDPAANY